MNKKWTSVEKLWDFVGSKVWGNAFDATEYGIFRHTLDVRNPLYMELKIIYDTIIVVVGHE